MENQEVMISYEIKILTKAWKSSEIFLLSNDLEKVWNPKLKQFQTKKK